MAFFCFTISFPSAAATIGFDATAYTSTETDSTVSRSVTVSAQGSTILARGVVVTMQTVDGTATGGALTYTDIVDVSFMFYRFSLQLHLTTQLCPWT